MAEKNYSIHDVYESIGENENLRNVLDHFKDNRFGNEKDFFEWWYESSNEGLGYKSPDELCKEGKQKRLETMLMDIIHAAHGG